MNPLVSALRSALLSLKYLPSRDTICQTRELRDRRGRRPKFSCFQSFSLHHPSIDLSYGVKAMETSASASPLSWRTAPSTPRTPEVAMLDNDDDVALEDGFIKYRAVKQLPTELLMSCKIHLEEKLCWYMSENFVYCV